MKLTLLAHLSTNKKGSYIFLAWKTITKLVLLNSFFFLIKENSKLSFAIESISHSGWQRGDGYWPQKTNIHHQPIFYFLKYM